MVTYCLLLLQAIVFLDVWWPARAANNKLPTIQTASYHANSKSFWQTASYLDKQEVILTNIKWCNFDKQQVILTNSKLCWQTVSNAILTNSKLLWQTKFRTLYTTYDLQDLGRKRAVLWRFTGIKSLNLDKNKGIQNKVIKENRWYFFPKTSTSHPERQSS